ncbi:MAG: PilZ domain-containing protein [Planctomycetota bacterium]
MSKPPSPIQRLRLSRAELDELAATMDQQDSKYSGQRGAHRRPVNRPAVLIQGQPGEVDSRHEVYIRNVSASGASVLHTAFVQTQLDCSLVMVSDDRTPVTVQATVVRCNHVAGHMHDVGLRFSKTLTDEQATHLSISAEDSGSAVEADPVAVRQAFDACRRLADHVHQLVEAGASAEEVLPLLDKLRNFEPTSRTAA